MATFAVTPHENPYELAHFATSVLHIQSQFLKENPLGDSYCRPNYVLSPVNYKEELPVIFHLSGYFSTGYQSFDMRTLESNMVQSIDKLSGGGQIPWAHHIFVDATTFYGGSQFINSAGCGNYEDYLLREVCEGVRTHFKVSTDEKKWCVMGASSGGYGSLHSVSCAETPFGVAVAIAPDSFFEASLLPELFRMAAQFREYKSIAQIKELVDQGELQEKRHFFSMMNILAMSLCYSPSSALEGPMIKFPVDLELGKIDQELWKSWLEKDPVHFLEKRSVALSGKTIYLDVGKYDNYSLQFGARQIANILKKHQINTVYNEFPGTHRGLSKRRLIALQWLSKIWENHGE